MVVHNCELMLQYEGGVSAFLTGAATYGIDLVAMADAAWDTLPADVVAEARGFMEFLYRGPEAKYRKALEEGFDNDGKHVATFEADKLKARYGLSEKVFIVCDTLKRLWRAAHPAISSYWKGDFENPGLQITVERAINRSGETFTCRRLKIRRDGAWLRIQLPSGRSLCYPNPRIKDLPGGKSAICYTGFNQYTKQWGDVLTYGGKLFENLCQAASADQMFYPMFEIEEAGYLPVLHVHDELVCETPDTEDFTADELGRMMCADLGWNAGLPLSAAGFEAYRYRKD